MRVPLLSQGMTLARRASSAATDTAGRAALAGLDAVLNWRYTDEAVERMLASPVADRAVAHALRGPLADAVARELGAAVDSPAVERAVTEIIESRLLDTIVERLLEAEELWLLVDEIARSPAVTEAIGQQSVGFADQVAGQVRVRSQRADARVERVARRLLRREER